MKVVFALILACLIAGFAILSTIHGDQLDELLDIALLERPAHMNIALTLLLLLFTASLLLAAIGTRGSSVLRAIRDLVSWSAVIVLLTAGYSFREELSSLGHRVIEELAPPGTVVSLPSQSNQPQAVRIRRGRDGHFLAQTEVNGVNLTMLIDTGASTVVLRPQDARRLGIEPERLRYSIPVQTANGTTYAAAVRLQQFAVGSIVFNNVEALVSRSNDLRDNLLGMSFLNRLRSYEFSGDYLTLRI